MFLSFLHNNHLKACNKAYMRKVIKISRNMSFECFHCVKQHNVKKKKNKKINLYEKTKQLLQKRCLLNVFELLTYQIT